MDHIIVDQSTTASPPLPPNWIQNYENTVTSLATYKLFSVDPNTSEFDTIAGVLNSTNLTVQQIVNPMLWLRFLNTRKDMIKLKTSDLNLLTQLQLSQEELLTSRYYSENFVMDPKVADVPYNDTMALLLHCTRTPANVEGILLNCFDDRLYNIRGLLGRGIYFTDDPRKAEHYDGCDGLIFICAVLLGDCLHLGETLPAMSSRVREPEKWTIQKRNINDLFFDSVVARPNRANEFVVYNRYQCYPLYKVNYVREPNFKYNCIYRDSQRNIPPFSWQTATDANIPMPTRLSINTWPFHAKTFFTRMEQEWRY